MTMELAKDENWPGIREVVAYLQRHGIPREMIRGVNIVGQVGRPFESVVTLAMSRADLEPREPEITRTLGEGRKLIGPTHSHLDGPCTDACFE